MHDSNQGTLLFELDETLDFHRGSYAYVLKHDLPWNKSWRKILKKKFNALIFFYEYAHKLTKVLKND